MKIIFIALKGLPYIGGIEKYTEEVGARLNKLGHEITVYVSYKDQTLTQYKGITIKKIKTPNLKGFDRLLLSRIALFKAIKEKPNIIHFHGFENTLLSGLAKLIGIKVVYQGHGLEWERERWNFFIKLYLRFNNTFVNLFPSLFFTAGTVVSRYQQNYYKSKYGNNFNYIPTGVNKPTFLQPNKIKQLGLEKNGYILFAARLVKEKGAHLLIDAYKNLDTNLKLVIAGDAKGEEEYIKNLKRISIGNDNIIFTGYQHGESLYELFSNSKMFILPSSIEGLPITLFEAMSYNIPTLSSNIPPNLEATANGKYGYHFEKGNSDSLSNQIKKILDTDNSLICKAAQNYVLETYTWDKIAASFETFYFKLFK